jgi:hypothetical protein
MNNEGKNKTLKHLLKCPYCGGPANHYHPISLKGRTLLVLVECWSGDLDKPSLAHLFIVKLKLVTRSRIIEEFEPEPRSEAEKQ